MTEQQLTTKRETDEENAFSVFGTLSFFIPL